jgi:hypothetical protein
VVRGCIGARWVRECSVLSDMPFAEAFSLDGGELLFLIDGRRSVALAMDLIAIETRVASRRPAELVLCIAQ